MSEDAQSSEKTWEKVQQEINEDLEKLFLNLARTAIGDLCPMVVSKQTRELIELFF